MIDIQSRISPINGYKSIYIYIVLVGECCFVAWLVFVGLWTEAEKIRGNNPSNANGV